LNNYKIKVIIKFSDQLSQNNWYISLTIKIDSKLVSYLIKLDTNLESNSISS